jgi:tetratricopeptide (TPR) repeat protein
MIFRSTSKISSGQPNSSAVAAPITARSPFRWRCTLYGLLLVVLLAWPAWQRVQATLYLAEAERLLAADDLGGAAAALNQLDELQPGLADVQYLLGVASRRAGVLDQAQFRLRRAERLGWSPEAIERQRLLARFQSGDIDQTRPAVEQLLQRDLNESETKEVYEALAKGYLSAFRVLEARTLLEYWLEWRPDAIQPKLWLGQLRENEYDYRGAAQLYESVLATNPDHRLARLRLAQMLVEQNETLAALGLLEQLFQETPDDLEVMIEVARCRRSAGRESAARELLDQLLARELPPKWRSLALVERSHLALAEKDVAAAIEQLTEAVRNSPDNQQAHYSLGLALAKDGQKELAQVYLDASASMLKRHDRIRELTSSLAAKPDSSELRYEVGRTLLELGLKQEALRWLILATSQGDALAEAHSALADLYAELGNQPLESRHRFLAKEASVAPTSPTKQAAYGPVREP